MGKPTHKSYKLYKVTTGHAEKAGETIRLDSFYVIAVDVKDVMAQIALDSAAEYVSSVELSLDLGDVRLPAA